MSASKQDPGAKSAADTTVARPPLILTILLALGGFAALAIALEGARTWSWWASAVLTAWRIGGTPAAPELFIYPAFFTMVLALSRPAPRAATARFLAIGLLWSVALFLADPALRAAIHAVAPTLAETGAAVTVRGTLLYGLLFAWMYLTFRQLVPRGKGFLTDGEAEQPGKGETPADGDGAG